MRMRSLVTLIVAASLGASFTLAQVDPPAAPADGAPPSAEPAAPAPPPAEPDISTKATTHETVAKGTLPALAGRWMILNDLDLAGRTRTVPSFWEITEKNGSPVVVERFVTLPLDLHELVEKRSTAGEKWEPTDEQLAAIRTGWADLPDQMRGVASVKNELWGKDAFIPEIEKEAGTKDAAWVVRQTYQFQPGGQRPVRQVNIFGTLAETAYGFSGNYSGVAVAMAPFPVPIPYNGGFRMIRLDPAPARGLLARLGDLFKGCGR